MHSKRLHTPSCTGRPGTETQTMHRIIRKVEMELALNQVKQQTRMRISFQGQDVNRGKLDMHSGFIVQHL